MKIRPRGRPLFVFRVRRDFDAVVHGSLYIAPVVFVFWTFPVETRSVRACLRTPVGGWVPAWVGVPVVLVSLGRLSVALWPSLGDSKALRLKSFSSWGCLCCYLGSCLNSTHRSPFVPPSLPFFVRGGIPLRPLSGAGMSQRICKIPTKRPPPFCVSHRVGLPRRMTCFRDIDSLSGLEH